MDTNTIASASALDAQTRGRKTLAEVAADAASYSNGRQLLDDLCLSVDGIPDEDVVNSQHYRHVSRRIAHLMFASDTVRSALRHERNPQPFKCDPSTGTSTSKKVSAQDFIDGKALQ